MVLAELIEEKYQKLAIGGHAHKLENVRFYLLDKPG